MQPFGDLDMVLFVRLSRLSLTVHVNRMDSRRKASQVLNNNTQGNRLRERAKGRWWNCVQILINAKQQIGKRGKKTQLTRRSPLKKRRAALDCSAIEEEEVEYLTIILGEVD